MGLALTHESAQKADVRLVQRCPAEPQEVYRCDRDQKRQEDGVHGGNLHAQVVEPEGHKADADVQCFPRDLVFVDEGAPFAVDGDQA